MAGTRYSHTGAHLQAVDQSIANTQVILLSKEENSRVEGYGRVVIYAPTTADFINYRRRYDDFAPEKSLASDFVTWPKMDTKGWTFFAEYASASDKNSDVANSPQRQISVLQKTSGNVVAIFAEQRWYQGSDVMYHARSSMYENSPNTSYMTTGGVSDGYLREKCKRVSLTQAMRVHPNMFLDTYFDKEQ